MPENKQEKQNKRSDYLKTLKRTSLWQLALFIIGFTNEWRLGVQDVSLGGVLFDAFTVMWTDNFILAAIFGLGYLITKRWAPKVSGWLNRTATSMLNWGVLALGGFALSMAFTVLSIQR
jgi:hypothetical protein